MKDFLKKLNSIDIKDLKNIELKNIDLKNIDLQDIKDKLKRRPDTLISIVLIVVCLFVIIQVWGSYKKKSFVMKSRVVELEEKLEVVETQKKLQEEYSAFIGSVRQPMDNKKLEPYISDIAFQNNINIVSVSEEEEISNDFAQVVKIEMDVASDNYEYLLAFIRDIEQSEYALRVEKWSAGLEGSSRRRSRGSSRQVVLGDDDPEIAAKIVIGVIKIRKN